MNILSDTAKATVLICSYLAINNNEIKPFTSVQWYDLGIKLINSDIKEPGNLIGMNSKCISDRLHVSLEYAERISKLLSRGANLAFCLDELERKSIYIVTKSDKEYPKRITEILGHKNAPPLLYYCGDLSLTNKPGIAIVGSRNIDRDGQLFAQKIANKAVEEKIIIYSGGARGVDEISEQAALSAGGYCVSFLADSMTKKIKVKEYREAISSGKLLMLTAVKPDMTFTVANAMNRNKLVYALSKAAFVIASDDHKGGTWNGAVDNIKNKWVNTYVWNNPRYKGNSLLIEKGAVGIPPLENVKISELVERPIPAEAEVIDLFSRPISMTDSVHDGRSESYRTINSIDVQSQNIQKKMGKDSIYRVVLPVLKDYLQEPKSLEEISNDLSIMRKQASEWLNIAIEENAIAKTKSPIKYYKK